MKPTKKEIIPLPFLAYFLPVVLLAFGGLLDSVYLTISHYRVYTDISYKSFCAISRALNCDTVSQSPYSIFLGIPVPVWGVVGYGFFLILLFFSRKADKGEKKIWTLLFIVSLLFSIYSIILAIISTRYIHSYCIMCLLSFGINFFLLYFTWIIRKRFHIYGVKRQIQSDFIFLWQIRKTSVPVLTSFMVLLLSLFFIIPEYWKISLADLPEQLPSGMTADGLPWIGAENPVVEITEYTDYQCFQCRKMHFFIRNLMGKKPGKIRLIHRHYPMDHQYNPLVKDPFHTGAGKLALLAIYAAERNKFWEMSDLLFEAASQKGEINIKTLAKKVGLDSRDLVKALYDRKTRIHLNADIQSGLRLGVSGTPAYLVNQQLYLGQLPADVLEQVMK